jgi:hypothetical protein
MLLLLLFQKMCMINIIGIHNSIFCILLLFFYEDISFIRKYYLKLEIYNLNFSSYFDYYLTFLFFFNGICFQIFIFFFKYYNLIED